MRTAQFQIVCIMPVYCQITDANIGSKARRLPMTYFSETLARKLAGRMTQENYEHCGDDIFTVRKVDEPVFSGREKVWRPVLAEHTATDFPF